MLASCDPIGPSVTRSSAPTLGIRQRATTFCVTAVLLVGAAACTSDPESEVVAVGEAPTPQLIIEVIPPVPTPQGAPTATFQSGATSESAAADAEFATSDTSGATITLDEPAAAEPAVEEPADAVADEPADTILDEPAVDPADDPADDVVDDIDLGFGGGDATGQFFKIRIRGEAEERQLADASPATNTLTMSLNPDDTGSITADLDITFADGTTAVASIADDDFEWDSERQSVRTTVSATIDVAGDASAVSTLAIADISTGVGSVCFSSGTCLSFEFG